jgi:isopentenyl diphosphate isomerase/L-lactate dehydrogenase-like FMN-dependent dehydrogenase
MLDILKDEFKKCMMMCGATNLAEIRSSHVVQAKL